MERRGGNNSLREENNMILQNFKAMAKELDDKHDRQERLVKISRDITIESKRIIFLLHTIDSRKDNKSQVLAEAKERLQKVCTNKFNLISKELSGRDLYQYLRGFSAGLQEFIEALSFWEFCSETPISSWTAIADNYFRFGPEEGTLQIPPMEYMMGLQDTTGELMRKAVNSLGSGDVDQCFQVCDILRGLYLGYLSVSIPRTGREWGRKMYTLHQSLLKSEYVCYCVKVRGKETAKWAANKPQPALVYDDEDEGVY